MTDVIFDSLQFKVFLYIQSEDFVPYNRLQRRIASLLHEPQITENSNQSPTSFMFRLINPLLGLGLLEVASMQNCFGVSTGNFQISYDGSQRTIQDCISSTLDVDLNAHPIELLQTLPTAESIIDKFSFVQEQSLNQYWNPQSARWLPYETDYRTSIGRNGNVIYQGIFLRKSPQDRLQQIPNYDSPFLDAFNTARCFMYAQRNHPLYSYSKTRQELVLTKSNLANSQPVVIERALVMYDLTQVRAPENYRSMMQRYQHIPQEAIIELQRIFGKSIVMEET